MPQDETAARNRDAWDRVTAITVTYNSASVIEGCLAAAADVKRFFVVDNASADDTVVRTRAALPAAEIIENVENLGFGRGNNLALEKTDTEFALLINPDARLRPGALELLIATADRFPEAGLVAPALIAPRNIRRLSHDVAYMRRPYYPRKRDAEPVPEGVFCTWSLSGAIMLVRMDVMRRIGYFDPKIFLYFEDNDLCERVRAAGFTLLQNPEAVAEHMEGKSVPPSLRTTFLINSSFSWARLYFIRKHWGRRAAWWNFSKLAPRYLFRMVFNALVFRWEKAFGAAAHVVGMVRWATGSV